MNVDSFDCTLLVLKSWHGRATIQYNTILGGRCVAEMTSVLAEIEREQQDQREDQYLLHNNIED